MLLLFSYERSRFIPSSTNRKGSIAQGRRGLAAGWTQNFQLTKRGRNFNRQERLAELLAFITVNYQADDMTRVVDAGLRNGREMRMSQPAQTSLPT